MRPEERTTAHRSAELRFGALLLCLAFGPLVCASFAASSTTSSGVQITQLTNALHDLEKQPEDAGNYTIPAGKSLTLRYRIFLHEGDERQGKVAERYQRFVGDDVRSLKLKAK